MRRLFRIFSLRLALGTPRMQGLSSNSALFWASENAGMRQANSDFIPLLATPENVGVTTHLWAPEKGGVRRPILIFSPHLALGTPRMQGLSSNSALFWAPEKAGMRQPILFFSPLLATPENVGVTARLWPPEKAGVRRPIMILSPRLALGTPKIGEHFRPIVGPRGGRAQAANSFFLPALGAGDPENAGVK